MKLHLPLHLIKALAFATVLYSPVYGESPTTITNINQLYREYHINGKRDFVFGNDITLLPWEATRDNANGHDPSSDQAIPYLSNWNSGENQTTTIDGNGYWIGELNHVHSHTGYISRSFSIDAKSTVSIKRLNFLNNYGAAPFQMKAGAVYHVGYLASFEECDFTGNHLKGAGAKLSYGQGGALYIGNSDTLSVSYVSKAELKDCNFRQNFIEIEQTSSDGTSCVGEGGALLANAYSAVTITGDKIHSVFDQNTVSVKWEGNTSSARGGAIFNEGAMTLNNVSFTRNGVENKSTAQVSEQIQASGGAIHFSSSFGAGNQMLTMNYCSFESNAVQGKGLNRGGAIYMNTIRAAQGFFTTSIFTDCTFTGNTVNAGIGSKGGAIYMEGTGDVALIAANKDVTFRGNLVSADDAAARRANAICFETGYRTPTERIINIDFKALNTYTEEQTAAGSSVQFYDSVDFNPHTSDSYFHFNRSENGTDYLGRVMFSGIDYQGDDAQSVASRTSTGNDHTHFYQWNGLVQITDKAIVGAKEAKKYAPDQYEIGAKSFTQNNGTLEISKEGHLLVDTFTLTKGTVNLGTNGRLTVNSFITNGSSWKDTTLDLSDKTGYLAANTIDLTKGVRLELGIQPHVSGLDTPCGWMVTAATISLQGSTLGIADSPLDYYMNSKFETSQNFLVFKGVNSETSYLGDDKTSVISETHDSSNVSDYYEGSWSYKVVTNPDGTKDLYAVWTVEGGPTGNVTPELSGGNVENSIWSTNSNMKSLSNLATGQIGIDRYRLKNCSNYWVTTIGDFDMHRSTGNGPGYDYDGFGYAVGGDARFCPDNVVLGMAFGNLFGKNNSREFSSRINQTSYIGLIYGGWLKEFNKKNSLNLTGTASYGVTSNRMKTYYSDGMRSSGKWDNNAMRFTLKAEWLRDMGNNWTLSPFVGVEYDDVNAKSFTESGDRPRFFDKGTMRNLALPVGIGLSKQYMLDNGKVWMHGISAAYLPDVYRENPSATVTRRTEDSISWTARGISTARNAGRFEYSTRLIFNPTWSTFAGYTVEVRKNALYQQASLGVSASF